MIGPIITLSSMGGDILGCTAQSCDHLFVNLCDQLFNLRDHGFQSVIKPDIYISTYKILHHHCLVCEKKLI